MWIIPLSTYRYDRRLYLANFHGFYVHNEASG